VTSIRALCGSISTAGYCCNFRGSTITSDAGLLAYRELDHTLGLTNTGADTLADARTGKNGRHRLAGLLRQSVFGRLAGYEDVNDAESLCRDPAMRWVVGERAITGSAASASQMGQFETKWLSRPENLVPLEDLPGQWLDKVHRRRPSKTIVLNAVRLQLHVLAYNLGNFMRTLAIPKAAVSWSLTSLREKPIEIGAKVISHGRYVTFQMAEVAVPRQMFAEILSLIARLRAPPAPA